MVDASIAPSTTTTIAPPKKGKAAPPPPAKANGAPAPPTPDAGSADVFGKSPAPGADGQGKTLGQVAVEMELGEGRRLEEETARGEKAIGDIEEESKELLMHPPEFKPPPPPESKAPQDPMKVWGSSAMMLAAIGSLFTRTPLTTAMNAASGVMDAYRKGDQDEMNYQYAQWKIANENYQTAFKYQEDYYKSLLGDLSHREDLVAKMTEEEKADIKASVDSVAAAFKDEVMIQQKSFEDQLHLMQYQSIANQRSVNASMQLMKLKEYQDFIGSDYYKNLQKTDPARAHAEAIGKGAQIEGIQNQLVKQINANPVVKNYWNANSAIEDMRKQYQRDDILDNAAAQIGLIDRWAYLETGSTRPSVAQYKAIMEKKGLQDVADVLVRLAAGHPALGRNQINHLMGTAESEYSGRKLGYYKLLLNNNNRPVAEESGMLPPSNDIDLLRDSVKAHPEQRDAYVKFFDQTYGDQFINPTIGEDLLEVWGE